MGIIAWIILGLAAGLVAQVLVPGRSRDGILVTTLIGVAGALLGGFLAQKVFHVVGIKGFFNISTWITAIAGAGLLLVAYHLFSGQNNGRRTGRRTSRRSSRWAAHR
jgi:uncharacterized membrane protein YeaQ/YmgE (transglycosylase-associated protein family)